MRIPAENIDYSWVEDAAGRDLRQSERALCGIKQQLVTFIYWALHLANDYN